MKSTLLRLSVLLLTFSVGVTIPLFKSHRSTESSLAVRSSGQGGVLSSRCPDDLIVKDMYLVISVPNDTDFYLGKRKVALAEISDGVSKQLGNQPPDDQVVLIKTAASVSFETLTLIARQLKSANVKCFEFILDKQKGGLK